MSGLRYFKRMEEDEIRSIALKVLSKEDFQDLAKAIYENKVNDAIAIAYKEMSSAQEAVLDTVRKDECDFVLMSHYRQAYDLLQALKSVANEDS